MRSYFPHASPAQLLTFGALSAAAIVLGIDLLVAATQNTEVGVLRVLTTVAAVVGAAWFHEKLTADTVADQPYDWAVDGI